jgi:hypothetical protein
VSAGVSGNAVRVTARRTAEQGDAVPLSFLALLGKSTFDLTVSSIAYVDYGAAAALGVGNGTFDYWVPANSNPWLAGMPAGTIANPGNPNKNHDTAGDAFVDDGKTKYDQTQKGNQGLGAVTGAVDSTLNYLLWGDYASKKASPITAGGIPIVPGSTITFDGLNGGANNTSSTTLYTGDGNTGWVVSNLKGAEHGKSDVRAPINSVIAVFLSDDKPNQGAAPARLDFGTASARNFLTLSPKLKQTFFIGDGRTSSGEVQRFVVPPGATRMFIGTMDAYEWNNNVGGFYVTAHILGKVHLVD